MLRTLSFALATTLLAVSARATTYYVDAGASPGGDGLSWSSAFNDLQSALAAAVDSDDVWVKAGTYLPSKQALPWDPRSVSFRPKLGVSLYGGFDGTEATLGERAGLYDQTILSGNLGIVGSTLDNAYHVVQVVTPDPGPPVRIDGFTIEGGNADAYINDNYGGGIFTANAVMQVAHCTLRDNAADWGGGISAPLAGRVEVVHSRFTGNIATYSGGGIWGDAIQLYVYNCEFRDNLAGNKGGALANRWTSPKLTQFQNVVFNGNSANHGGAVWMAGGSGVAGGGLFTNCTFAYNFAASSGGALFASPNAQQPAKSKIKNSILFHNTALAGRQLKGPHQVVFSDVQGGWPGKGNIKIDPRFRSVDDMHIRPSSAARNRAHYAKVLPDYFDLDADGNKQERTPFDLDGNPRAVTATRVDMGAYEVQ